VILRRTMRLALIAGLIAAASATTALADDPADMVASAKTLAKAAPETLSRRTLGQVALPTIADAKFRNVRAHYRRYELVNDQVIFCGELDAPIPSSGQRSGWTKFAYLPGDPTTLITATPGLGMREIGPQVLKTLCETGKENWLSGEFTAEFQRKPGQLAASE
jgi:hypothetical protein